DLQRKLKHFKAAGKTYKKRFKLFERIINRKSYFVDKWFTVEDDGEVTLEVRQNEDDWQEGCPLKILSPGEQNLFLLYFQLIFELPKKCPKNGMCLMMIDEPETSLYPERLADFYDNLNYINEELGRYENYQFLIATHSPLIAFRHNRMVTEMATDF
ncbi:MAG: ATP-binding protein, partial [Treponema sp.]|nr:ATP-binding protein [Treponema sp.]